MRADVVVVVSTYSKSHWSMRKKRLHNKFIWHDDATYARRVQRCAIAVRSRITIWTQQSAVSRPAGPLRACTSYKVLRELEIVLQYFISFCYILYRYIQQYRKKRSQSFLHKKQWKEKEKKLAMQEGYAYACIRKQQARVRFYIWDRNASILWHAWNMMSVHWYFLDKNK